MATAEPGAPRGQLTSTTRSTTCSPRSPPSRASSSRTRLPRTVAVP